MSQQNNSLAPVKHIHHPSHDDRALWLLCEKVLRTLIFLGVGIDLNCSYVVLYVCYLGNTFCLVMDTFLFVRFNLGVLWVLSGYSLREVV